jgi:hypothetical protein
MGLWWPAADSDKLRALADQWNGFASTIHDLNCNLDNTINRISADNVGVVPSEISHYWYSTWSGTGQYFDHGRQYCLAIATSLEQFATEVDNARQQILGILEQLIIDLAASEAVAAVTSFFDFGISEAAEVAVGTDMLAEAIAQAFAVSEELAGICATIIENIASGLLAAGFNSLVNDGNSIGGGLAGGLAGTGVDELTHMALPVGLLNAFGGAAIGSLAGTVASNAGSIFGSHTLQIPDAGSAPSFAGDTNVPDWAAAVTSPGGSGIPGVVAAGASVGASAAAGLAGAAAGVTQAPPAAAGIRPPAPPYTGGQPVAPPPAGSPPAPPPPPPPASPGPTSSETGDGVTVNVYDEPGATAPVTVNVYDGGQAAGVVAPPPGPGGAGLVAPPPGPVAPPPGPIRVDPVHPITPGGPPTTLTASFVPPADGSHAATPAPPPPPPAPAGGPGGTPPPPPPPVATPGMPATPGLEGGIGGISAPGPLPPPPPGAPHGADGGVHPLEAVPGEHPLPGPEAKSGEGEQMMPLMGGTGMAGGGAADPPPPPPRRRVQPDENG